MSNSKSRKRTSGKTRSSSGTANQPQNTPETIDCVESLLQLSSGQTPSSSGTANQPQNTPEAIRCAENLIVMKHSDRNHQQEEAETEQELEAQKEALQIQEEVEQGSFYGIGNYVPGRLPPLPDHLLRLIQGQECSKPFEKQMTETDVNHTYKRLIIHKADVNRYLLPLFNEKEKLAEGVNVTVYNTDGAEYKMELRIWNSGTPILAGEGWKSFREAQGLIAYKDFLTFWMFRNADTTDLCLFITCRRLPAVRKAIKKKGRP